MPYGLKDEEFNKIQNKIAKKLYEVPSFDRAAFFSRMHRAGTKGSNDRTAQNTQIEGEN